MAESLHCSPEAVTSLLIGYTPIQNTKLEKKEHQNSADGFLRLVQPEGRRQEVGRRLHSGGRYPAPVGGEPWVIQAHS